MTQKNESLFSLGMDNILEGVPKGSLVITVSSPEVSIGTFLAQVSNQRQTLYFSTKRSQELIEEEMFLATGKYDRNRTNPTDYEVEELFSVPKGNIDERLNSKISSVEEESNVIINEMGTISEDLSDGDEFEQIMRELQKTTAEKNLLTIVNFVAPSYSALSESQQLVLDMSDVLLKMTVDNKTGQLITDLRIDKYKNLSEVDLEEFQKNIKIRDMVTIPRTSEV